MRAYNLWHRESFVFIQNNQDEFLIHTRSEDCDYSAGFNDLSVGGVLLENEDSKRNAQRYIRERLGINVTIDELEYVGK